MVGILMHLILSQISLRLSSVLFLLFTLFCSLAVISSILPSSLLSLSSASNSLLLTYFRVFLISVVMLFVSVSLFFNSSRGFFIDSCTFSILFSKCWSFYYHFFFLNPSAEIYISSSFFGLLCDSSLRGISLTFHYLFNFFCFSSLYPGFKVQFSLPFVLRSFQCFEYGSSRWDMWCFILCLFFLWWARLSNVAVLSTDDWVFIFVLFVCFFVLGVPHGLQLMVGNTGSCVQVVSYVCLHSIWYPRGLVLW